jgi:NADP-dependent 3-hydroxy acid dehydrogenase YdfG
MSVALVTYCSTPIGQSIAYEVATAGHTVYAGIPAMTRENARRAEELVLLATDCGLAINPIELDTVDPTSADLAARSIGWLDGRLEAVIHAPIGDPDDEFEIAPSPRIDPDAAIRGRVWVNRACLPLMRASGGGYVIYADDAGSATVPMKPAPGLEIVETTIHAREMTGGAAPRSMTKNGVYVGHEIVRLLDLPVSPRAYRGCI